MDAGLFIYFPRDPGQNIYFKVFDGQDIYFKKLPASPPPPPASTGCPPTKKAPVSTIPPSDPLPSPAESNGHPLCVFRL